MRVQKSGELYKDDINKRIEPLFIVDARNYKKYHDYLVGENYTIKNEAPKENPDNRVPGAFARKICQQHKGYSAKPGYITYKSDKAPEYLERMKKEVLDKNDETLLTAELYESAIGYGKTYELLKSVKYGSMIQIRQYNIDMGAGVMVYDNTLDKNPIAFITKTTFTDIIATKEISVIELVIYYKDRYVTYQKKQDEKTFTEIDRKEHPFGDIPAIEYIPNRDKIPIYKPVIAMIDEHDKITSSSYADERERFANSYLLALRRFNDALDDDGLSEADKARLIRIFDGLGEITSADGSPVTNVNNAIAFLTKPSRGTDTAEAADRFERLIYDLSMTVNTNDQTFNAATGIALKLKLLPMEWLAADIESYFSRGLQRRFELIGNAMQALKEMSPEEITINFRRNIPVDVEALATQAGLLKGILSDETILHIFPADIVPSIEEELRRLESNLPNLPTEGA